ERRRSYQRGYHPLRLHSAAIFIADPTTAASSIFSVAEIISYMSRFMKLLPGDVIATGTPEGVAMGMDPREYLQPGDEVHLGVEGLGEQRQTVVAFGEA
ncbi:MAG: fumarylacetoacetate hydrolase family protein, partial [Pseudomonadota bacterium]